MSIISDLRFEFISSAGETFELVASDKEILITPSTRIYSVVPSDYLIIFTVGELEEAYVENFMLVLIY